MYKIIKNVIESGRYELSDMLAKIDTIWLQGNITEEERAELADLARENAVPENSYDISRQIDSIFKNLSEMGTVILELTERVKTLEGGASEEPPEEVDEYPEYAQPTGAHDAYYTGAKITRNSKRYTCIAPEGVAVAWPPETYPAYWEEIE